MSTDRKLAWAALILGVAGLIPLIHESARTATAVALVILIAVIALGFIEWKMNRTVLTTTCLAKKVILKDSSGRAAVLRRTQTVRVNFGSVDQLWFRNMVADGQLGPVRIDGCAPSQITSMGCLQSYAIHLKPALNRGDERTITLECEVYDSFLDDHEGLLHEVALDTRKVELEVELPENRPCRNASLMLEAGGEPARTLEKPLIYNGGRCIRSVIKNPKTGFTYHLHWDW
ncbi:hypothetical protein [Paracidobacterium acidisoli]|uniref:Uncharacterized protein n=1 Tax=Paracidobacterium acidisoli TaxID=2303751 RepID=A0A372ILN9_9BACT|nr:hypothetical protein [Paracidobacterium acidisoli]MBT9332477.1 hypothetical protein [Paracidobacterium acidisoli]